MTLDADAVARWARQIILPEVGGGGQLRLLGASAAVAGDGEAARLARFLLERAGVRARAAERPDADADVTLDLSGRRDSVVAHGRAARAARRPFIAAAAGTARATVATLVGRPCVDCAALDLATAAPASPPLELATAALAAGEALRVLLATPDAGRLQALDLDAMDLVARALEPGGGCAACEAAAP